MKQANKTRQECVVRKSNLALLLLLLIVMAAGLNAAAALPPPASVPYGKLRPNAVAPTAALLPVHDAGDVSVSTNLVLTFSEPVTKAATGTITITHGETGQDISLADVSLSDDGREATINPANFPYATLVAVSIPEGAFTDGTGNPYAGTTANTWRFTTGPPPDNTAPTVAGLSPAHNATDVLVGSNLVLTFSEPVVTGSGSIIITHGETSQSIAVSSVQLSDDGQTATLDPADFPYATGVGVSVPQGAFEDLAGNAFVGIEAAEWSFTTKAEPDGKAPTATLSPADGAGNVSVSTNLVLTFSEPVTKAATGTISITHGDTGQDISLADVSLSDDGLTATINPANFPYATTVSVAVPNAAFSDLAGNPYAGTTASTWRFNTGEAPDNTAPTVADLSPAHNATGVSVSSNLALTFSEPVTKAATGSITITHGETSQSISLADVSLSPDGRTATIDPANFPYATGVSVSVPGTAFSDLAGNAFAGIGAADWNFTTGAEPDGKAPTATLSPADGAGNVSVSTNLVLTFSEPVTKAATGTISITHGETGQSISLADVTLSDDGREAIINPANFPYATTVSVAVPNAAFSDLAGNPYAGTTASTWRFTTGTAPDTQAPTATLSPVNGATNVPVGDNLVLTFSEPVTKGTGSIAITHGETGQSIGVADVSLSPDGRTATVNPADFPYATAVSVSVPGTAFSDLAGNAFAGVAASNWRFTTGTAPDTQAPTATLSPANGATNVPVNSNLVLTFSEPVTKATTGSITITQGASSQIITLSSVALSASGLTATIDASNFPYSTTVGVTVPNTAFKDLAGNAYAGTTSSTWSFTTGAAPDTQAPTATLSPANGAANVPVGSNLVLTFSEPVTKATTGSITITQGATSQTIALSSVVLSASGLTATIDPANFPYSTPVGVTVPNTAFKDLAGNAYAGTTSSTWSFTTGSAPDTQAPTATLSPANGATNVPISSNLVLTFSEPVTKATTGSITITQGATSQTIALSSVVLSASGLTATIDASNFPYSTTIGVAVPNTAFKDLAGNAYAGTTSSTWSFTTGSAPDTQAPTATLSPANGATNVPVSSNLVLTFSEPVTKAATGSITITQGATSQSIALSSVVLSASGLTATIDPANFPYSTTVGVAVPNTAFKDLAGNAYAGTTSSTWSFTTGTAPDTQAPTATLSPANGATNVPVSSNLVLTFSEPVTKATTGSITITQGASSQTIALSSVVLSASGLTATIDASNFPYSTSVGVTVPSTAFKDLAGNAYAGTTGSTWSFTTGSAPDTQAPTATLSPANGATNVPVSSNLVLTFSEPVTKATTGSITITQGATSQTIALSSVVLSASGLTATIDASNFPYSTTIGVAVPNTAFKDLAGNAYAGTTGSTWSFTTGSAPDTQAPTATLSPANGATNVSASSNLILTFSEPVTKATTGSITITHGATSQSIALSSVVLSASGLTATIDPANFPYSSTVGVTVPNTAFKDLAGNAYVGTTSSTWSFTTGTAPDTQAPTATLSPVNGATNVSVSSNLVLTFSEPVTKATTGSITITHGATSQTIALSSVILSASGLTATIDPANFPNATAVGVAVPNTAFKDLAGNAYAGTTAAGWSFTTAAVTVQEIKVNFQDAATIPPTGWLRDYGQAFGTRTGANQGTNMTYGWKKRSDGTLLDLSVGGSSNLGNGRNRNSTLSPDIDVLLATIMHMQADDLPTTFNGTRVEGYWEMKVPNGGYDVTVSAGDGVVNTDPEVHYLNVEGISAVAGFVPSGLAGSLTRFKSGTVRVVVSDGNLTINADGGTNTKITSVRIVPVTTPFLHWAGNPPTVAVAQGGTGSFTMPLKTSNLATATASLSAVYGAGGSGWLSFNASQSTTTPTVNFTCTPGALPVGKYTATVTAAATGYASASFLVTLNVGASRPYVKASSPTDGALNVSVSIANVAANSLYIPEVAGFKSAVNNATLSGTTVKLLKISNGIETQLSGNVQGTIGGDAITFTPSFALESNTTYRFVITDGVKSQSGAAFLPYQATFKTGTVTTNGGQLTGVSFKPLPQAHTEGQQYTTLAIGPDRKLYGLMLTGTIKRFPINADGSLGTPQEINTLINTYGARSAVGLTFDPAATAANPVVWVSHCSAGLTNAPLFDGNISRLSGANLETAQLVITRLPRSKGDHLVNSLAFGTDGALYISQGSNSSMGAYDATWQREESLLSGTILRLDRSKLTGLTLPLNVETTASLSYINSASSTSMRFPDGKYNPYASTSPLTIYASGVRNAYDLVWHSNGQLYVPTNGSASGGNSPASVAGTRRPNGSPYTGQTIPATTAVQVQNDWLFRVNPAKPVGYYGHPNPLRGEYVPNRGYRDNSLYPSSIAADINYRNAAYNFGLNKSPNGVIEYKNAVAFGGALKGRLLVCRFSGAGDIMVLEPGSMTKVTTTADDYIYDITKAWTGQGTPGIPGLSGFANPLDLVEDTQTGNLYVSEHAWDENDTRPPRITLLKVSAVVGQGIATVSPAKIVENDVVGGTAGKYRTVTLANTGSGNLKVTSIAVTGLDASQFLMVGAPAASATSPYTLLPNSAVSFSVAFNPTTAGVKTAKIQISSENNAVREVALSGLGTKGLGGANEPSLQQVLDVHGVPVTAGDDDKTTAVINSLTPKATLLGGELHIQQFVRSNDGPVAIEVLGVFGPQSTGGTVTGFGWYPAGSTTVKNGLFTVPNSGYQTVNVPVTGSRSFDPGAAVFGFYSQWPFFANRVVYQEDRLNAFTGAIPHHLRVYPLKTATGTTVPDAYVLAYEEDVAGFDYQDLAVIVRNVKPAPVTTVMIDFKPAASATQTGYTPDNGLAYDATRGFGWIDPVTKAPKLNQAYARERAGTDELRVRTFNAMRPTSSGSASYANWEYKVNNGFYKVTVQVGDPDFYDSFHYINAEGVPVISNFVPTATTKYRVATKTVEVKDGKLTIDANGTPTNNNTKIGYLLITPATSLAGRLAADDNPAEAEPAGLDVVAYPNPTDGRVTLAFTGLRAEETVAVSVISSLGVVYRQVNYPVTTENGSLELDMAGLKAGTYLVRVQSGERVKLLRVVKR
jgi:hypothetical protein